MLLMRRPGGLAHAARKRSVLFTGVLTLGSIAVIMGAVLLLRHAGFFPGGGGGQRDWLMWAHSGSHLGSGGRASGADLGAYGDVMHADMFRKCDMRSEWGNISMTVPVHDETVGMWVCRTGDYQESLVNLMMSFMQPGDVIIDAGANFGTYTVLFSKKVGPAGTVIAFEPQRLMYTLLAINTIGNGQTNLHLHHAALGFEVGYTQMDSTMQDGASQGQSFESAFTNTTQPLNFGGRPIGRGGEKVRMVTLDFLNLTKVSFIKIDVQGSEKLLFWGARETIRRCRPIINFEKSADVGTSVDFSQKVLSKENIEAMKIPPEVVSFNMTSFLQGLGYTLVGAISEDQIWKPTQPASKAALNAVYKLVAAGTRFS